MPRSLERIDTPGASAQLKVFEIRNGDANALVTTLRTLFSVPAEGEAAAPGGISQGGVVRMQFSVDPRTNSIIAAGSAEDLVVVEAILLRLDQGDIRERITTVYRLNNAFAECLANALNNWLQTQRQAEAEAGCDHQPVRANRTRSDHRARSRHEQPDRERHAADLQRSRRGDSRSSTSGRRWS